MRLNSLKWKGRKGKEAEREVKERERRGSERDRDEESMRQS